VPDPSPLTETERLVAENRKYGAFVIMLVPLTSGRFAVMGADRQLQGAYDPATTLGEIALTPLPIRRATTVLREIDPDPTWEIDL
jgi:hypothetical protein